MDFTISHYENKYFAEPINLDITVLENIRPYSFGAKNKLCICEITYDTNSIRLHRFTNYYKKYAEDNNKIYENPYKGLGLRLLKSVIIKLIDEKKINENYTFYVQPYSNKNDKLINFYESMSFTFIDNDNDNDKIMKTTVGNFLNKTANIITFS